MLFNTFSTSHVIFVQRKKNNLTSTIIYYIYFFKTVYIRLKKILRTERVSCVCVYHLIQFIVYLVFLATQFLQ